MKKIEELIVIVLFVSFSGFGQNQPEKKIADSAFSTRADSTAPQGKEDQTFTNPFSPEGAANAPAADSSGNIGASAVPIEKDKPVALQGTGPRKTSLDFLLDLSLGASLSRFNPESSFFSSQMEPDVFFNVGLMVPFLEKYYAEVSFRDVRLRYVISDSEGAASGSYFTTKSEESMNFVSLAFNIGMRFESGQFTPYFYATCEPAFMTSAAEFVKRKSYSSFPGDSTAYSVESVQDQDVTGNRTRFQIFAGGGLGVEINYGYGFIYIDGAVKAALRNTGYLDYGPGRSSSTLIVFPISMGLRFYL